MRIVSIFLILSFSYSLTMQKSKELEHIWLTPVFDFYTPIEWPTYLTDTIKIVNKSSLSGSHQVSDSQLIVNKTIINSDCAKRIKLKNGEDRHPHIQIKRQEDNRIAFEYKYNETQQHYCIDANLNSISESQPPADTITRLKKGSYRTHISREIKMNKYCSILNKQPLITTNKPHAIFLDDQGNIHTIQKEKLNVPILGLLGDLFIFMVRYHDVQLTNYDTTKKQHIILKTNPFGWRNAIRTINTLFLIWIACIAYNKLTQV